MFPAPLAPAAVAIALATAPLAALAEVPQVVTDIAPVQSLVAAVMEGVGQPAMLLPPGATPHEVALRPSEAQAVARADILFWIGPELSPGIARAVAAAPATAQVVELLDLPGTTLVPVRLNEVHPGEEATGAGDDDGDDDGHGHAGGTDPHAWLDPANARLWLRSIADTLAQADPAHAADYAANAARADAAIAAATGDAAAILAPAAGRRAVVLHDAFAAWEAAFDMPRPLAVAASDAARPGAAHLTALRAEVAAQGITCILAEPQFDPKLAALVAEGTGARIAVWDPLGSNLEAGPGQYPALLRALATAYAACTAP